jgi:hypothetical protein
MNVCVVDRAETKRRRKMDIEAALRWAHVEELPKAEAMRRAITRGPDGEGRAWERIENYVTLLTEIDYNAYGVLPDPLRMGTPHEDALTIARAVARFTDHVVVLPEGWNPIADLGDLGSDGAACIREALDMVTRVGAQGRRQCKARPDHLLIRHAVLGGCPDWRIEEKPERRVVCENGKPKWFRRSLVWAGDELTGQWEEVEVDGRNPRTKRPYDDAYRKTYLDPDPVLSIAARAEYEIWHGMMMLLGEMLAGEMESIELQPFRRSSRPWEMPDAPGSSVLRVDGYVMPRLEGQRGGV